MISKQDKQAILNGAYGITNWQSHRRLKEGLIFHTKEDVRAWLKAMRSSRK